MTQGMNDNIRPNNRAADSKLAKTGCSSSIEELHQKQSEIQIQLDQVLQVAKALALKQEHKLNSMILNKLNSTDSAITASTQNDKTTGKNFYTCQSADNDDDEDDEDELIEFQAIENELKISELNRQIDGIQKQLRLKLYERLVSNVTNNKPKLQLERQSNSVDLPDASSNSNDDSGGSTRLNSASNNSMSRPSPSSSSCSDKVATTSPTSSSIALSSPDAGDQMFKTATDAQVNSSSPAIPQLVHSDRQRWMNDSLKLMVISELNCLQSNLQQEQSGMGTSEVSNYKLSDTINRTNLRNSSVNSDLECIEEGEEDNLESENDDVMTRDDSEHFRVTYEEKFSSFMRNADEANGYFKALSQVSADQQDMSVRMANISSSHGSGYPSATTFNPVSICGTRDKPSEQLHTKHTHTSVDSVNGGYSAGQGISGIDASSITNQLVSPEGQTRVIMPRPKIIDNANQNSIPTSAITSNRPLTIYLPKSDDEEIDLAEYIQAIGHDLNIISKDLRLTSSQACGYLWKRCSNNTKKWLKRYFCFNRESRLVCYYDHEHQLVKDATFSRALRRGKAIPFQNISDVYVDHKLSSERDNQKRKNSFGGDSKSHVFVLATMNRKYVLASRAETMRAWIDILFTAAKANDYNNDVVDYTKEPQDFSRDALDASMATTVSTTGTNEASLSFAAANDH